LNWRKRTRAGGALVATISKRAQGEPITTNVHRSRDGNPREIGALGSLSSERIVTEGASERRVREAEGGDDNVLPKTVLASDNARTVPVTIAVVAATLSSWGSTAASIRATFTFNAANSASNFALFGSKILTCSVTAFCSL
jgi:hypothetical protein